ncbi:hypothetical protein DL546_006622 [Coniochaeta pulveracea]|uniref:WW domain-containing protein n=1 Tax=Coniochaeta pulveracea TaxID=177199 RepID=A0A420YKX0_9PEZI|nr:hypothetical protein DL546_006622 [Coniochaeta pulveracea]
MSFFKKLTKEFDELGLGSKQKKDYDEDLAYSGKRDAYPPSQPYGDPSSNSGYVATPAQYQSPSPAPAQNPVTPTYSPPADRPPIPQGWVPEWDHRYQRWYYYDTTTGRSQWEAPGYGQPLEDRGAQPQAAHTQYVGGGGQYDGHYSSHGDGQYGYGEEKKSRGHAGMILGAAGGLVAGAVIADALDNSDDEGYRAAPPPPPPVPQEYYPPPPADLSESDRESLKEAREDYEEALDDARSSSASSSDQEELEEAQEEYYEELEEAYDD